jgi:Glyoxalase-like domain
MAIARFKDLCLGATVLEPQRAWTVLADPEGNEFCAFT